MTAEEFPSNVSDFIHQYLPTMDHVEVLLFLFASPGAMCLPRAVEEATRIKLADVQRVLTEFTRAGLARVHDGSYGIEPATPYGEVIAVLARLYNTRPVSLVRVIYSRRAPFQTFADAFRLRKEDEK